MVPKRPGSVYPIAASTTANSSSPGTTAPPSKESKTWPDVDRRSGLERRIGTDRRNETDIVWKNKRFGGERRTGKDRRKDWPDWAPKDKKKK